jgi:hypothetical protein
MSTYYAYTIKPSLEVFPELEGKGRVISNFPSDWSEDAKNEIKDVVKSKEGTPFRLLDDDGIVYATGNQISTESEFEPLDRFMWSWGVTELQQKKNGVWETL